MPEKDFKIPERERPEKEVKKQEEKLSKEARLLLKKKEKVGKEGLSNADKESSIDMKFLGTTIAQSYPFLQTAGNAAEGFIYTYPFKIGETEMSEKYRTTYFTKYDEESEIIGTNSYDIILILKKTLSNCPN